MDASLSQDRILPKIEKIEVSTAASIGFLSFLMLLFSRYHAVLGMAFPVILGCKIRFLLET